MSNTRERKARSIGDMRGRDGQHRQNPSTRAVDNGMRTITPSGIDIGQQSGHDIQDSVPKPDKSADTGTEGSDEPDNDADDR